MSVSESPVLPCWYCDGKDGDGQPYDAAVHTGWLCEACDERRELRTRIERMEAVVAEARTLYEESLERGGSMAGNRFADVLAALDAPTINLTISRDIRSCPNAVSWCDGPDQFEGICNACLAVWTDEADEKNEGWETFIAIDGQPAIRRRNQHEGGQSVKENATNG